MNKPIIIWPEKKKRYDGSFRPIDFNLYFWLNIANLTSFDNTSGNLIVCARSLEEARELCREVDAIRYDATIYGILPTFRIKCANHENKFLGHFILVCPFEVLRIGQVLGIPLPLNKEDKYNEDNSKE